VLTLEVWMNKRREKEDLERRRENLSLEFIIVSIRGDTSCLNIVYCIDGEELEKETKANKLCNKLC